MSTEIFKRVRQKFIPIEANYKNEIWQIDLMFINVHTHKYILMCCIDIYSRYGQIYLMKDKTAEEARLGIMKFINKIGTPKFIMFDDGGEFKGNAQKYLEDIAETTKITTYGDGTDNKKIKTKMAIVERWNGTIRHSIHIYLEQSGEKKLTQETLNELCDDYNRRKHSGIQVKPVDVMNDKVKPQRVMYKHNIEANELKFKEGDAVRLLQQYKTMEKGRKDKPIWSREVYEIIERKGNRFKISDGKYYPYTRLMKSHYEITIPRNADNAEDESDFMTIDNDGEDTEEAEPIPRKAKPTAKTRNKEKVHIQTREKSTRVRKQKVMYDV